jgi:hypothetical protein
LRKTDGRTNVSSIQEEELVISYSQIAAWQRCHKAWYWGYVEQVTSKSSPDYLQLGSYLHALLEIGYVHLQYGFNTDDVAEIVRDFGVSRLSTLMPVKDLGILTRAVRLANKYFTVMQPIMDEGARILGVERHFKIRLYTPQGRPFFLQGYIDLVLEIEGRIWIIDHKSSAGKFWSPLQLQLDGQLTTYSAVIPNTFGVGINFLNTYDYKDWDMAPVDKLYKRVLSYRTATEKEAVLNNFGVIVDDILDRKERDDFPYSLTSNCARCPFSELCLMELKGFGPADVRLLISESFAKKENRHETSDDETGEDGYS